MKQTKLKCHIAGLKNSPSPLGSPEGVLHLHGERVQPPAQYKHGAYSPNVEMSPVDDEEKVRIQYKVMRKEINIGAT